MSKWTEHVKGEAKRLNTTYGCALSLPEVKESYYAKNPDVVKRPSVKKTPKASKSQWANFVRSEAARLGISYGCALLVPEVKLNYKKKFQPNRKMRIAVNKKLPESLHGLYGEYYEKIIGKKVKPEIKLEDVEIEEPDYKGEVALEDIENEELEEEEEVDEIVEALFDKFIKGRSFFGKEFKSVPRREDILKWIEGLNITQLKEVVEILNISVGRYTDKKISLSLSKDKMIEKIKEQFHSDKKTGDFFMFLILIDDGDDFFEKILSKKEEPKKIESIEDYIEDLFNQRFKGKTYFRKTFKKIPTKNDIFDWLQSLERQELKQVANAMNSSADNKLEKISLNLSRENMIIKIKEVFKCNKETGSCFDFLNFLDEDKPISLSLKEAIEPKKKKLKGGLIGPAIRRDYSPQIRDLLKKVGDKKITNMEIQRVPIDSGMKILMDTLSLGAYSKTTKKLGYDRVFHLSMIIRLEGLSYPLVVEKNETINISKRIPPMKRGGARFGIPITMSISLNEMLENTRKIQGTKMFLYDAFTRNCQMFIRDLLKNSGLLTTRLEEFIMQDAAKIAEGMPWYFSSVAKGLTNLGAQFNRIIYGKGMF